MAADDWRLEGTYFEACNSNIVCPSIFLEQPPKGFYENFVGWHIERGHMGDVNLDDLNVSLWFHAPSVLTDGNWKAALYIDDRANDVQNDAIQKLWNGEAGGHLAVLASLVSEIKGVKVVPIEFKEYGKKRTLKVGGIGLIDMDELEGEGGRQVMITNHPFAMSPGYPAVVSRSNKLEYSDYDVQGWSHTGTNGYSAPFWYSPLSE